MNGDRLTGPLGASLKKYIQNENRGFNNLNNEIDNFINIAPFNSKSKEAEAAHRISLRALINNYTENVYQDLLVSVNLCESPIEELLLDAFILISVENGYGLRLHTKNRLVHFTLNNYPELTILPQAEIGDFRTDFLLRYEDIIPDFNNQTKTDSGQEIPGRKNVISKIVVECDGHDFHEKTKEQAKKDKQRDRILQSTGFKVFRFTGSEIWDDAIRCADEVFKELEKASGGF